MKRWLFNGLAAVSLVIVLVMSVVWVFSYWKNFDFSLDFDQRSFSLGIVQGRVGIGWSMPVSLNIERPFEVREFLGFEYYVGVAGIYGGIHDLMYGTTVPAWFVVFIFAILPLIWFRKFRKNHAPQIGLCKVCGYDLRATLDLCPECGTVPNQPKNSK